MPLEIREDPVCGMAVAPGTSVGKSQFGEWLYHFCSERCKLIDLGAWADEKYRVPVVEEKDQLESQDPDTAPPPAATK